MLPDSFTFSLCCPWNFSSWRTKWDQLATWISVMQTMVFLYQHWDNLLEYFLLLFPFSFPALLKSKFCRSFPFPCTILLKRRYLFWTIVTDLFSLLLSSALGHRKFTITYLSEDIKGFSVLFVLEVTVVGKLPKPSHCGSTAHFPGLWGRIKWHGFV